MIDATARVFELEGEAEFVEAQLDKLLPLVTTGGVFVKAPMPQEGDDESQEQLALEMKSNGSKKSKRGSSSRPPKGHSCADRMMLLREDGFFKGQKTPVQIVEGLGAKGWTHNSNQVSAAGGQMFKRGDIQRTKVGNGFAYFWDRE